MTAKILRLSSLVLLTIFISAPPCWAKAKGYFYVVGYTLAEKKVYFSPVFSLQVQDKDYSDDEYVTDVVLLQKIEAQFKDFLAQHNSMDASDFTISARGAYKKEAYAGMLFNKEKKRYTNKKFEVKILNDIAFND